MAVFITTEGRKNGQCEAETVGIEYSVRGNGNWEGTLLWEIAFVHCSKHRNFMRQSFPSHVYGFSSTISVGVPESPARGRRWPPILGTLETADFGLFPAHGPGQLIKARRYTHANQGIAIYPVAVISGVDCRYPPQPNHIANYKNPATEIVSFPLEVAIVQRYVPGS